MDTAKKELSRHPRTCGNAKPHSQPRKAAKKIGFPLCAACLNLALAAILLLPASLLYASVWADKGDYFYPFTPSVDFIQKPAPVIGSSRTYTIREGDTLLDIARDFDLGFNELRLLYPQQDPWVLTPGKELTIPGKWIPPDPLHSQQCPIVINLPEMRLFLFNFSRKLIRTYPIGIGKTSDPTPTGGFVISEKIKDPVWTVPPGLTNEYQIAQIPPGENNPLGKYWLGLKGSHSGLHGTNFPWSVGRLATHGCMRLYPEDISRIFSLVDYGTQVQIVYQPVKFGTRRNRIFVEVHPDVYDRIDDLPAHAYRLLQKKGLISRVDMDKLRLALQRKSGLPVNISPGPAHRESAAVSSPPLPE